MTLLAAAAVTACATDDPHAGVAGHGRLTVVETNEHDLVMAGADVASHLGLWEDTLEVEIAVGQAVGQSLATGEADIGLDAPNRLVGAIQQGLEATIVGPTIGSWDQYLVAAKDIGADEPDDLRGARFGITRFGSAGHFSTVKMADTLGWSESDYAVVTMGSLDGLVAGVQNGTIDAFMWSAYPALTLEMQGHVDVVDSVRDLVGPNPLVVIAVRNEVIEERPDAVAAFCRGFYAANTMLQRDPGLTERIFVGDWDLDTRVVQQVIDDELPLLATDSRITDEMLQNMAEATRFTVADAESLDLTRMRSLYRSCSDL